MHACMHAQSSTPYILTESTSNLPRIDSFKIGLIVPSRPCNVQFLIYIGTERNETKRNRTKCKQWNTDRIAIQILSRLYYCSVAAKDSSYSKSISFILHRYCLTNPFFTLPRFFFFFFFGVSSLTLVAFIFCNVFFISSYSFSPTFSTLQSFTHAFMNQRHLYFNLNLSVYLF